MRLIRAAIHRYLTGCVCCFPGVALIKACTTRDQLPICTRTSVNLRKQKDKKCTHSLLDTAHKYQKQHVCRSRGCNLISNMELQKFLQLETKTRYKTKLPCYTQKSYWSSGIGTQCNNILGDFTGSVCLNMKRLNIVVFDRLSEQAPVQVRLSALVGWYLLV